jgi:5-aminopentanamidase
MAALTLQVLQAAHRHWLFADLLTALEAELALAAAAGADLLLTPELFASGYGDLAHTARSALHAEGPELAAVAALCRRMGVGVVFTYPERAGPGCYNAASVIDGHGRRLGHYRKRRLPNAYERTSFEPATASCLFTLSDVRCAVLICYDVEFPELVRRLAIDGAELVLVPTALAGRWELVATRVVPTRAYENGLFMAYANYAALPGSDMAGLSCVCGPDGEDLGRLAGPPDRLTVTVDTRAIAAVRARMPLLAMALADPVPVSRG